MSDNGSRSGRAQRCARGGVCVGILFALLCAALPRAVLAAADVRIIVDVSASMGEADPDNVRSRAVGLLLRLLPDDGEAGVWTYGRYVNMLVPHGPSNDLWKETAAIRTQALESVGRRSNLREAVERASWDRDAGGGPVHLVLLTDGRVDVSDDPAVNAAERTRLLEELAPELAAAGYRVHTLALSDQADVGLLGQLSALTGGWHGRLESAEALPEGLLSLLGWLGGTATLEVAAGGTFRVAPGTREVTVLKLGGRAGGAVSLAGPDGVRLDPTTPRAAVRWHLADDYQMLTVEDPAAGVWRFEGDTDGVRVYAYGDLTIGYPGLPATVFPGELQSFELALTGRGGPVVDEAFLDLLTVNVDLVGSDGSVPVVVERTDDGRFRINLQNLRGRGNYDLDTRVEGPTFTYRLALPFVLDNPLSVEVHPAPDGFVLWAQVNAWEIDHDSLRVAAWVEHPPAAAKLFPVARLPGGLWKVEVPGTRGLFEVALDISGKYRNGKDFKLRTESLRVVLPVTQIQYADMDLEGRPLLAAELPHGQQPATRQMPETPPPVEGPVAPEPVPEPALATLPVGLALAAGCGNVAVALLLWWVLGQRRHAGTLAPAIARLRKLADIPEAAA